MESRVTLFTIVLSLITFSCTDQSTTPSKPGLLLESPTVTVTPMWYGSIAVRGGTGPINVTTIDDSTVAEAYVSGPYYDGEEKWWKLMCQGKKYGVTAVRLADAAGTSTAVIFVTVARMAASPERIMVRQHQSSSAEIHGMTLPLTVVQPPDTSVADVTVIGSTVLIDAFGAGRTSVSFADASTPSNILLIPITVTPSAWYTTPGTVTLTTEWGTMTFNGILPVPRNSGRRYGNGAAGTLEPGYAAIITGFRSSSPGPDEQFSLYFSYSGSGPATVTQPAPPGSDQFVRIGLRFGGDRAPMTGQDFFLITARVSVTESTPTRLVGTFSGEGISPGHPFDSGRDEVMVYNGTFDVPLFPSLTGNEYAVPVLWRYYGNASRDSLILNGPR